MTSWCYNRKNGSAQNDRKIAPTSARRSDGDRSVVCYRCRRNTFHRLGDLLFQQYQIYSGAGFPKRGRFLEFKRTLASPATTRASVRLDDAVRRNTGQFAIAAGEHFVIFAINRGFAQAVLRYLLSGFLASFWYNLATYGTGEREKSASWRSRC